MPAPPIAPAHQCTSYRGRFPAYSRSSDRIAASTSSSSGTTDSSATTTRAVFFALSTSVSTSSTSLPRRHEYRGRRSVSSLSPGDVRLCSGIYGGPDGTQRREQAPWTRIALALGLQRDCQFTDLLDAVTIPKTLDATVPRQDLVPDDYAGDLESLGLPTLSGWDDYPTITAGLLSVPAGDRTLWTPIRGGDGFRNCPGGPCRSRSEPTGRTDATTSSEQRLPLSRWVSHPWHSSRVACSGCRQVTHSTGPHWQTNSGRCRSRIPTTSRCQRPWRFSSREP